MTFEPTFTITNRISNALHKIDITRGFFEAAHLSEEWMKEMKNHAFILEAHHTTHIEGSQLTLEQSDQLLSGTPVAGADPEDERELLNYRDAFQFVSKSETYSKPTTIDIIKRIHYFLVEGVRGGEASPGEFREKQNWIVDMETMKAVYTPPPPERISGLMDEFVTWLGSHHEFPPLLVAGIAQFQLVHIHPFLDGNGRAARLLSTLCLFLAGYDFKFLFTLSEFYDRDRSVYYRAIQSVREQEMDMTPWLEYFCDGLASQMDEVKEQGEKMIRIQLLSRKHSLTVRHRLILNHIVKEAELSIQDSEQQFPDVNRRTLQRDLKKLVEIGILESHGNTNQLKYHLKGK